MRGAWVDVGMPVPVAGADGAPCRAFIRCEE